MRKNTDYIENFKKNCNMWLWIIIIFVVGGAIIGLISNNGEGKGCLFGAFAGLLEGASCLLQLFFVFVVVALACWIFG